MKRPLSPQLAARRREVATLAHKGWTQAAIAKQLQIPQGTVSRDLAAMRTFWREFPVYDYEKVRFEQLQKIDILEAEAWAAWQRSQQQRRSAALTRGKSGELSRTTLQDQFGDPRYLREIAWCVRQRYEMIGVQPPTVPPERAKPEIPECDLTKSFRHYLMLHGMFGDPPYKPLGGLRAEHYAALVAEHEHDPYLHKLLRQVSEQDNPTPPDAAVGGPGGQDNEQGFPEDDSSAELSP